MSSQQTPDSNSQQLSRQSSAPTQQFSRSSTALDRNRDVRAFLVCLPHKELLFINFPLLDHDGTDYRSNEISGVLDSLPIRGSQKYEQLLATIIAAAAKKATPATVFWHVNMHATWAMSQSNNYFAQLGVVYQKALAPLSDAEIVAVLREMSGEGAAGCLFFVNGT